MALLLSATSPAVGEYYFAQANAPAPFSGVVTAPAFIATGTGQPGDDGRFIARGDASGGSPALAFQMRKGGGPALQQWNIGMTDTPAGANSGNNFAIIAYDDASLPLSTPLSINRATGAIETGDILTVGDGTEVGGALLEVNGTLGPSRVYDASYNPLPPALAPITAFAAADNAVVPNAPGPGTTTVPLGGTFTVANTGMYILTGLLSYDGSVGTTFTAAPEDFFSVNCNPSPPSPGAGFGGVTVSLTNATTVDRAWEATSTLILTAGVPYQANFILQNVSGTVAATGAAVLNGSFDLVALC